MQMPFLFLIIVIDEKGECNQSEKSDTNEGHLVIF